MPEEVCYASVSIIYACGRIAVASLVLLCFVGLLRVGEALNMQKTDMLLPTEHGYGNCIILMLRTEKHRAPDSSRIFIWHPRVVAYFERYKQWAAGADTKLFPTTYSTVNR